MMVELFLVCCLLAAGSKEPAYNSKEPAYNSQEPAYNSQEPAYNSQEPAYNGGAGVPGKDVQRLASEARTADLRGDWQRLLRAHDAFAAQPPSAWTEYYLGYVDWRQSSLAFMGQGLPAVAECLRHAQGHLTKALELAPAFTEARLLLVIVDGGSMNADAARVPELGPRLSANFKQVVAEAPQNPRVKYLQAFLGFYIPNRTREQKDAALADWHKAAEAFPERAPANEPEWGRAEAWAWLGGTLITDGKPAEAKAALERALTIRKDFWWVKQIALPQATRLSSHGQLP